MIGKKRLWQGKKVDKLRAAILPMTRNEHLKLVIKAVKRQAAISKTIRNAPLKPVVKVEKLPAVILQTIVKKLPRPVEWAANTAMGADAKAVTAIADRR